ncbi:TFIIH C1-like domain containing protein [Parasponia andersonii]|uniref:TFIIH C1-like domain containing protein n=1 Tax=Parasponia andersonii TaxID=3476 RepID=A0A2P5BH91_PARAD|nr:TFIIH C1-like domain containing protein [Parasponia andersonii]
MMLFQQQQQQSRVVDENMYNLTSASGEASVSSSGNRAETGTNNNFPQQYFASPVPQSQPAAKKKRNLPGNPDPDAEVIALSPKTLLATNRFICEICNKGFQRDQNLQLHRRGHNLPWKLKQRTSKEVKKKVYVCPEASCVHHDPSRALGDLTGIKKHFCRKHGEKKWKCDKCSKRYAVQSDWKAHSKTCGTREYRCDCGTLFSRRDSFITHRAFCDALAEESARSAINGGVGVGVGVEPDPLGSSSSSTILSHLNLQTQLMNTNSQHFHSFSLKKEQQSFTPTSGLIRPDLPPWLSGPTQSHDLSSSSSIFSTTLDQDFSQQESITLLHGATPNPNPNPNPNLGGGALPPYQPPPSAHMSATALLQKAAQMGATMSSAAASSPAIMMRPHQAHHQSAAADSGATAATITSSTAIGKFGLNLSSSRGHHQNQQDQTAPIAQGFGYGHKASTGTSNTSTPPPLLHHDMMCNTDTIEDPFKGVILSCKKDGNSLNLDAFTRTTAIAAAAAAVQLNKTDDSGGGNINGEGLTRDFLGLRPLSHSEILNLAGLGNTINISRDHQSNQPHKPW